jgi:hypothetical protein
VIINLSQSLSEISCTPVINHAIVKYIVIKLGLAVDWGFFIYWLLTCIKVKNTRRKFYSFNTRLEVY